MTQNLNQLERLGIAHKVTDIIIRYVELHQEEWWSVRNDVSERAEAFKDGSVEELADYLICDWCGKDRYYIPELAWNWAANEVNTWDTQQCIDYSGGLDEMFEHKGAYPEVKQISYRRKALYKLHEQTYALWSEDFESYADAWKPYVPYNVVYKEVIQILNNVSA